MAYPAAGSIDIIPLRSKLQGRFMEPGDGDYDKAKRLSFYGGEDSRPASSIRRLGSTGIG
jgi:hypothetical protein